MSKRPKALIYGRDEMPPRLAVAVLALQHAGLALVFLVYAVLIGKAAGFTPEQQHAMVTGTLLACGLGAALQARGAPWGSGLLAVPIAGPVFMPVASIQLTRRSTGSSPRNRPCPMCAHCSGVGSRRSSRGSWPMMARATRRAVV